MYGSIHPADTYIREGKRHKEEPPVAAAGREDGKTGLMVMLVREGERRTGKTNMGTERAIWQQNKRKREFSMHLLVSARPNTTP